VTDRLGNLNTASNVLSWNYDTLRPTATLAAISPVATRLAGTGSFRLTIPETVTGLTPGSFAVTGGTITSITGATSPYTIVFTPTALVNSGSISISLPTNRVLDRVSLGNTASSTLTWTYDTLPPTLTLASTGVISLANQSNYTLSGLCSENGRTVNITLESVTSAALCISGNWSRTLSTAGAIDGNINLSLTLSDVVGNITTVTSQ
jgi:large repetitive protein